MNRHIAKFAIAAVLACGSTVAFADDPTASCSRSAISFPVERSGAGLLRRGTVSGGPDANGLPERAGLSLRADARRARAQGAGFAQKSSRAALSPPVA